MLTFDECIQKAPISIICIGTQREIVERYIDVEDSHALDTVNVEFAEDCRQALSMALHEPEPRVIWGAIRYMKCNKWPLEKKLKLLNAYAIANIEISDEVTDEDLSHMQCAIPIEH